MTLIPCKQCATEIIPPPDQPADQPLTCPACQTVFHPPALAHQPTPPPMRGLPSKMSFKTVNDELILTQRTGGWGHAALCGLVSFILGYGLLFSDRLLVEFLFNPLTWFMIVLVYYSLDRVVNRTEVRLDAQHLRIKHGPLPPWKNRRFDASNINQLYVKRRVEKGKKSSTTYYDLYLTSRKRSPQAVVTDLESAEQALFLEQELERKLGLADEPVSGDYHPARAYEFSGWEEFAQTNQLTYTPGKLLSGYRVDGHYRGYAVELTAEPIGLITPTKTHLTLTRPAKPPPAEALSLEAVKVLLHIPWPMKIDWTGEFKVADKGITFTYEQSEVETNPTHLQVILDTLYALSEAYPQLIASGGAVIPHLQTVAATKNHPARMVAAHVIQEIAPTTAHWRQVDTAALLCPRCLTRCADHQADLPLAFDVGYFGCRTCHQSHQFLTAERVVAQINDQTEAEPTQQETTLTVPWQPGQPLFDFDAVTINQASDETVERFAVQVGNDTDPLRQARYGSMRCVIAPGCRLSANTQRILQRTFGQVTVVSPPPSNREREAAQWLAEDEEERSQHD